MSDRRTDILQKHWTDYCKQHPFTKNNGKRHEEPDWQENAMDEYAKEKALELLDHMAKNRIISLHDREEGSFFLYRGEHLTKEQLFENYSIVVGI